MALQQFFVRVTQMPNPKSQYLNPKQAQMTKIRNSKQEHLVIWTLILFGVWCLVFGICPVWVSGPRPDLTNNRLDSNVPR